MCARVSVSKLFTQKIWKSKATGFGSREAKELYSEKGTRKEWQSATTLYGYPMNPVTRSMQRQIVNALCLGERESAASLLSHIGYNEQVLRANHFVHILEYCALTPDPLFIMEIWRTMEEKGVGLNNRCHLLMIQALCRGGYLEEAFNLMSSCGESEDLYPTLTKYNALLGASAAMKSITYASKCLDLMEHGMVGKNEITYMELLKLAVLQKNLSAVHDIWKEYSRYYSPNLISLRKFIGSFAKLGDLEAGCEALQQLVALVWQGGLTIKRNALGKMNIVKFDIPIPFYSNLDWNKCKKADASSVPSVCQNYEKGFDLEEVKSVGTVLHEHKSLAVTKILRFSFTDVIRACPRARNCQLAEQLFFQMHKLGVEPSRGAYDGLMRVLVRVRGYQHGIEMLKIMQKKNWTPHDSTLMAISIGCSKSLELDLAEAFSDQMCRKYPNAYPYNAMLEACDTLDQPERGVHILGKMKALKVPPNIRTYEWLFSLFARVNGLYESGNMLSQKDAAIRIKAIENDMVRNGIQHSFTSIRNLLRALGTEGMISGLLHYLRVAENQFSLLGTPIYNIVLHSLNEAKEFQMATNVFKTLMSNGFRPNVVTWTTMIDCCSITGSFKSAQGLIAMMIRHGYSVETQTYTALIKIVLALGDFNEALALLDQACTEGIELDAQLFNTVLHAALRKNRIDIIEYVMVRMNEERVPPDPVTCGHVFFAYVNRGFHNTAMEALQVMSIHMLSKQDIEENIKIFEDEYIYAEDSEAESRIVNLFKNSMENVAVALLNLRWCAMSGNTVSWSTHQSQWVKRLMATNSSR